MGLKERSMINRSAMNISEEESNVWRVNRFRERERDRERIKQRVPQMKRHKTNNDKQRRLTIRDSAPNWSE